MKESFLNELLLIEKDDLLINDINVFLFIISFPIELEIKEIKQFCYILDNEEKQHLNKYKVERQQVEFLIGRILLKGIMGKIYNKNPMEISFAKNDFGKLYLKKNINELNLNFNLSHTDSKLVCGITKIGRLGIDVENTEKNYFDVMEAVFLPKEITYVNSQSNFIERNNAFYKIWTRKEAYVKLIGRGFSLSPLKFTVPSCEDSTATKNNIQYYTFSPSNGCMLSVAVEMEENNQQIKFNEIYLGVEELISLVMN